jgi:FkbM family methyltransferase
MKKVIKSLFFKWYGLMFKLRVTRSVLNYFFENGSSEYRSFIIRNFEKPNFDFNWKTKLLNNKYVVVPVGKDYRSYQFSYNYKWHNIGLSLAEKYVFDQIDYNSIYIDVGANFGLRSMYAASENREIILFEPNHELHTFTKSLFEQNRFVNYTIEPVCLSDSIGETTFYISGSSYLSSRNQSNSDKDGHGGTTKKITVALNTLDNYLSKYQDKVVGLIKIDAEGEDLQVLKGAKKCLEIYRPFIIIECETDKLKKDVIEFISNFNYDVVGIHASKDWKTSLSQLEKYKSCNDLLLIPN